MKRSLKYLLILSLTLGASQFAKAQDDLPSGKEVLAKYCEATGGVEAYKNIKTMVAESEMSIPQAGITGGTIKVQVKFPKQLRGDISIPGFGDIKRGCNGDVLWESSNVMGSRIITGKEADFLLEEISMDSIFGFEEYYSKMENQGIEEIGGEKCYKIDLEAKSGIKKVAWFSVESGLQVQTKQTVVTQMGPIKVTSTYSDYKESGGIKSARKTEQEMQNMTQVIKVKEIKYNEAVTDDTFELPGDIQKIVDAKAKKKESSDDKE